MAAHLLIDIHKDTSKGTANYPESGLRYWWLITLYLSLLSTSYSPYRIVHPSAQRRLYSGTRTGCKQTQLPDEACPDPSVRALGYVNLPRGIWLCTPRLGSNDNVFTIHFLAGSFTCASGIYTSMGVKHVQHDTLSHFITDRASSFGLFDEALKQLYSAHEIYHSNEAEVTSYSRKASSWNSRQHRN